MKIYRSPLRLIGTAIACGFANSTSFAETRDLSAPTEINGVPCQHQVELHSKGAIKRCTLSRDYTVAGVALPIGTELQFNGAGEVEACRLGQPAILAGLALPAGSAVQFHQSKMFSGTLPQATSIRGLLLPTKATLFFSNVWEPEVHDTWRCWLPAKTLLQGHLCTATEDGIGHVIYLSGKLRAIWLAQDEEIDGVPCTSSQNPLRMPMRLLFYGTDCMAWFYENGHLQQGLVSRDCTIQGRKCKAGDIVRLTLDGQLDPSQKTLGVSSRGPVVPGR